MDNRVAIMKNRQEQERLTDEAFTALLGVHRTTWAKVKSGDRKPGLKLLSAFDQQFPHERIFDSISSEPHQTRQNKLWGALRALARVLSLGLWSPKANQSTKSKTEGGE